MLDDHMVPIRVTTHAYKIAPGLMIYVLKKYDEILSHRQKVQETLNKLRDIGK